MKANEIFQEIQKVDDRLSELNDKLELEGVELSQIEGIYFLRNSANRNKLEIPKLLNWLAGLGFVADGYVKEETDGNGD